MIKGIIIWGFETLPSAEQEVWIDRILYADNNINGAELAKLIDVCLGKLKHIMNTRKVTIFKPEGIAAYEELENMVEKSGRDIVAEMGVDDIVDLVHELKEITGENKNPGMLS